MTARSVSMASPFHWLAKAVDVGRKQPRALFGGFALLIAVGMIPSVVQGLAQALMPGATGLVYGLVIGLSLVLVPPLTGAAFRLLHDCEAGRPAMATDLFNGYRDRAFAVRMILTSVLLMLGYLAVLTLLFTVVPGKEFFAELFARFLAAPPGGEPDLANLPSLPPGFLVWLLAASALMVVLGNAYMLAFAQAALAGQAPVAAVVGGLAATLRNLLPLVGFFLVASIAGFFALLLVGLVFGVLAGVLAMLSPLLATLLVLPLYLLLALAIYVVMFGFYYHAWREIFGGQASLPSDALEA
jgi:hypothetical protein